MPPQTSLGKLVLPTVETCPHRRCVAENATRFECDLLRTISGATDGSLCEVQPDACRACCESFPPAASRWNPVIASLLFDLTDQVVTRGGIEGCSTESARTLQAKVHAALEVEAGLGQAIVPARVSGQCRFLGERLPTNGKSPTQQEWQCHHPSHHVTTPDHCRLCRDWSSQPTISRHLTPREMVPPPATRSGPPVKKWAVGVLTAPRREATLEWCLDSIVRAGWDRPHLFVDGLVRIPSRYDHLPITWHEQPVGAWPNSWLALAELVQSQPEADAYVLLQDDAAMYDRGNLREYLESVLWPGNKPSLVSLYCSEAYTVLEPGWRALSRQWIWGALAFVFPRELAREFLTDPQVMAHRWSNTGNGLSHVDVLIGEWTTARHHAVHYPCPSLVQHVGNTSCIWSNIHNQGFRRADWFAGDLETPFARNERLSDFPEHHFPCRAELQSEYSRRIELGRERMSQRRVVICGLCRNVRHFLPRFAARTEQLGAMFQDYRVVLFENDSTDATLEFLTDWQKLNSRVQVLSDRLGTIRFPQIRSSERATRMAEYRNRYRDHALEHFGDFDNLIVVDTDLGGGWSNDGVANTFGHEDWDFVGSCGLLRTSSDYGSEWTHFDAWAFRAQGHPQAHANVEVNSMVFERGEPLVPVASCFGGLGVYRMAAIQSAEYSGPDCEHVILHDRMRQQGFGRTFLNPNQIVLYSPT